MENQNQITTTQSNLPTVLQASPLVSVRSVKEALEYPTLNNQIKEHGAVEVIAAFIFEVTKNLQGFNVKETMTRQQIELFCEDFLIQYKHESLADLKLMFAGARMGKYGSANSYIDSTKLLEWFSKYLAEKADERERQHKSRKKVESKPYVVIPPEKFAEIKGVISKSEQQKKDNIKRRNELAVIARSSGFLVNTRRKIIRWIVEKNPDQFTEKEKYINSQPMPENNEAVKQLIEQFNFRLIKPINNG